MSIRHLTALLPCAALIVLCHPSRAQDAPALIKDLGSAVTVTSSDPRNFFPLGAQVAFEAKDDEAGDELWISDGTTAGTRRVRDLNPGSDGSWPWPHALVGGRLAFGARTESLGYETWLTDGTSAGTTLLADLAPGVADGEGGDFVSFAGATYFLGADVDHGSELFKTDGTTAGTVLVKDVLPGPESSRPDSLRLVGGRLVFTADDGVNGYELWSSDGTTGGTTLLKDIVPGPQGIRSDLPLVAGGVMYIPIWTPAEGAELWRTDGTAAGTVLVADIEPGPRGSDPGSLVEYGGLVYFRACTSATGCEPWRTDGTAAGTVLVADIAPGPASSVGYDWTGLFTPSGGLLYFAADDGMRGLEPWRTDGTLAGTSIVRDIVPAPYQGSGPESFVDFGGRAAFAASDPAFGQELWTSDGTAAGTAMVEDIAPGPADSYPQSLTSANGLLWFGARTDAAGLEPWVSDGTSAGTRQLANIQPEKTGSNPDGLTDAGGRLWMRVPPEAGAGSSGEWVSDGTSAGTVLALPGAPYVGPPVVVGARTVFLAWTASSSPRTVPIVSDGSAPGTRLLRPGLSSDSLSMVRSGSLAFFAATDGSTGMELWRTDGTAAGTTQVIDIASGSGDSRPVPVADVQSTLFFSATSSLSGSPQRELWTTDGTAANTLRVAVISADASGTFGPGPATSAALGAKLFFFSTDPASGCEPWISDGTAGGTMVLQDIAPGAAYGLDPFGRPSPVVLAGRVLFAAYGASGVELWSSDGTPSGTRLVSDVFPGSGGSQPQHLTVAGTSAFFSAVTPAEGDELWMTDGTAAGTVMVADVRPGVEGSSIASMVALPGTSSVVFAANDGISGSELWRSDGTAAGTRLLYDVRPGPEGSDPRELTVSGGVIAFSADGDGNGREPWAMSFGSGTVPDGARVLGMPLTVSKAAAGDITLAWSPSCVASDDDYVVYEGRIGDFASHAPVACSTGGLTTDTLTPAAGVAATYYLVAPRTSTREGSLGARSDGVPRPHAAGSCVPVVAGACR